MLTMFSFGSLAWAATISEISPPLEKPATVMRCAGTPAARSAWTCSSTRVRAKRCGLVFSVRSSAITSRPLVAKASRIFWYSNGPR